MTLRQLSAKQGTARNAASARPSSYVSRVQRISSGCQHSGNCRCRSRLNVQAAASNGNVAVLPIPQLAGGGAFELVLRPAGGAAATASSDPQMNLAQR